MPEVWPGVPRLLSFNQKHRKAMLNIHRILHPTDFSPSAEAALQQALLLAQKHNATLDVLYVVPTFGEDPIRGALAATANKESFYRTLWVTAEQKLSVFLAGTDARKIHVRPILTTHASAAEGILQYAAGEKANLIVMGSQGRQHLGEFLLGTTAEKVVRKAEAPVLTVPAPGATTPPGGIIDRLLVPVDFSRHAAEALANAKELAAVYRASIDLLHVVGTAQEEALYEAGVLHREAVETEMEARARARLEKLYDTVPGPNAPARFHAVTGYPAAAILRFAEQQEVGMVVLATHGLTGWQQFFYGSVAEKVVRSAPCPVFTVKSFGTSLLPGPPVRAHSQEALEVLS